MFNSRRIDIDPFCDMCPLPAVCSPRISIICKRRREVPTAERIRRVGDAETFPNSTLNLAKKCFMDRDYKNRIIFDIRWPRLKKYQKITWIMRYVELEEEIKRLASVLNLPQNCADNALKIAKQLVGRGFSPQALAAASLIMACRMLKMPRPIEDFAGFVNDIKKMKKTLRELSALMKTPPQLEHYVGIIAARVGVSPVVAKSAVELLQRNRRALQGRNPWAAAAAALWLSGVDMSLLKQFASPSAIRIIARRLK